MGGLPPDGEECIFYGKSGKKDTGRGMLGGDRGSKRGIL